ncbi:MAG TPA: efflux RND transporter periplasmic adaptor subunit [Bacillales bacterium]|nr:efflux RND transporter periplasmic adaptor subunit [Bacillales bacterium]
MKKLVSIIIVLGIVIIGGGVGAGYYYMQSTQYVKSDDAFVEGDMQNIIAVQSGQIDQWNVDEGDKVSEGDVLGTINTQEKGKAVTLDIKATHDGTVVKKAVSEGQMVRQGMTVAVTADLDHLYIKANISEEDLRNVETGQDVDIHVNAYPDTTFDGTVKRLGDATVDSFSVLPTSNSSGNYTEQTKRIPVYISIKSELGKHLVPGLNANVSIER